MGKDDKGHELEPDQPISVVKFARSIEAIFEILFQLFGLYIVYLAFNYVGKEILGAENFSSDTLLSLVVLPAIYILKDSHIVLEPFTIKISYSDQDVSVERGILTKRRDCLKFGTVENVELVTTWLGRKVGYGTLNIYAYGCWVELPNIKDAPNIQLKLENKIRKTKDHN